MPLSESDLEMRTTEEETDDRRPKASYPKTASSRPSSDLVAQTRRAASYSNSHQAPEALTERLGNPSSV